MNKKQGNDVRKQIKISPEMDAKLKELLKTHNLKLCKLVRLLLAKWIDYGQQGDPKG